MPIRDFGVWKGKLADLTSSPRRLDTHIYLLLDQGDKTGIYEAIINNKSGPHPESGLIFWLHQDCHPMNPIRSETGLGPNLFGGVIANPEVGEIVPMDHTLDEYISHLVNRARECDATVYIFGQSDEGRLRNIHRNQGSVGQWRIENGRGADGGIFIEYPDGSWDVLLMAFLGQSISSTEGGYERGDSLTDHMEGHGRIPVEGPTEILPDNPDLALIPRIAIVALELGKVDDNVAQPHKVHLCNMTNEPVPIKGWRIRFQDGSFFSIDKEEVLPPRGGRIIVDVPYILLTATVDELMLQDASEKPWDAVSITERARERSGSMIYFGRWIAKRPPITVP